MTTSELNLIPGIDWTKESVRLYTPAGVTHSAKGELSAHPVTIQQQWWAMGLDITPTDDYLSITVYSTECATGRVGDFKEALKENNNNGRLLKPWIGARSYYFWSRNRPVEYNTGLQLRIYKDLKMTMLRSALLPDGDTTKRIYYVIKGFDKEKAISFQPTVEATAQSIIDAAKESYEFTLVETDEEVKNLRKTLPLKSINCILQNFEKKAGDLRSGFISYISGSNDAIFCKETIDILHEWFGYDKKENEYRKSYYFKKVYCNSSINMLWKLLTWCAAPSKESVQKLDKNEKAEKIIASYQDFLNDPANYNVQLWDRQEDDIILLFPRKYTGDYYYSRSKPTICLFVYNVKTKKRFYGEKNSEWSFPIPSLEKITEHFYSKTFKEKGSKVIFKKSTKQIFADTNVDWCLTNAADVLIKNDFKRYCNDPDRLISFGYYFAVIKGPLILEILATSGILLFEQLLKARLFNLYFLALTAAGNGGLSHYFASGPKHIMSPSAILYYNEKGKNLQSMFNVPLRVLRMINDRTSFKEVSYNGSRRALERVIPNMCDLVRNFGKQIASADDETLKFWIETSMDRSSNFSYRLTSIKQIFPDSTTLSEYRQIFEKYDTKINLFRDYWSMRERLSKYQEQHPEKEGVFSEKKYPLKPEKATRFLPFVENMVDRQTYAYYYPQRLNPSMFRKRLSEEYYKQAFEEGRGTFVYDNAGQLLGASIKMTPGENLYYLHDEVSYWMRFFQDSTKDSDFKKAVERIKDLEWKDSKTGLEIIAPASIHELQQEGAVLSHCVASYADAIIDGTENIMFLRRTDMPNNPYYTVEVLPKGDIRQVHCFGNGDLTNNGQREAYRRSQYSVYDHDFDIIGFLTKWARAFPDRINASTVRAHYGALCAIRR